MNAETFCEHFATFADAMNGVEKLRGMILQLAVQGKLVPQDTGDECAVALLPIIREERIKRYGANRATSAIAVPHTDGPFELPSNWCWVELSSVLLKLTDGTHRSPPNGPSGDFKYISAKNIRPPGVDLSNVTYITAAHHQEIFSRCDPDLGDILYVKDGATTGNVTINDLDEPFSLLSSVALLKIPSLISNRYLLQVLRSPFFYDAMRGDMSGVAITRVTLAKMERALFPLPPLAEQRRIVEKVDQLLGLCDELAARQAAQREKRQRLVGATLDRLVSTRNPAEFPTHAHRLRNHFDQLFDTPTTIPQLRQTILQLAVQGQLVPQDPNDEPVPMHRDDAEERNRRTADTDDESVKSWPFDVPANWSWLRLRDTPVSLKYGTSVKCDYGGNGVPVLRIPNVVGGRIDLEDLKYGELTEKEQSDLRLQKGDLLLIRSNGSTGIVGRTAVVDDNAIGFAYAGYLVRVRYSTDTWFPDFLHLAMISQATRDQIEGPIRTTSGVKNINSTEIGRLMLPLPPLAEQKRIVTKVTELLSLCDALEAKITQAESASTQLVSAAVHSLLQN
jgi:type I restriction enzyme S subunit